MANLTAYVPPVPVPPIAPDFAYCNTGYGVGLSGSVAMYAGGILPQGALPHLYTVNDPAELSGFFHLPYETSFSGVAVSVEVASPVDIDQISLVPNDIRGMAGWLARYCIGTRGTGGFMTRGIQDLVKYVTDPTSNLDAPQYPDDTAFITVTLSTPAHAHSFPGDYDPQMAIFLRQAEIAALNRVEPSAHEEIADRIFRYAKQAGLMRRVGHVAWWADPEDKEGDTGAGPKILYPVNETDLSAATISRRRSLQGSSQGPVRESP